MHKIHNLEDRTRQLIKRLEKTLKPMSREFYEAGRRCDVIYLETTFPLVLNESGTLGHPIVLNASGTLGKPTPFDVLIRRFYQGVNDTLKIEKDQFKRAFLFLTTLPYFVPTRDAFLDYGLADDSQERVRFAEKAYLGMFSESPSFVSKSFMNAGIDFAANIISLSKLYRSGRHLILALDMLQASASDIASDISCNAEHTEGADIPNYPRIVKAFQGEMKDIIKIGKIKLYNPYYQSPKPTVDTIEMIKIVAENADKFVARFASMHGYRIPRQ